MTSASLNSRTAKDLAEMARKRGVNGWHSMRKEQLVRALLRLAKAKSTKLRIGATKPTKAAAPSRRAITSKGKTFSKPATKVLKPASPPKRDAAALERIRKVRASLERMRNLASATDENSSGRPVKERVVVMVRGPYWLHVYWDVTRRNVERARAAMGQDWHSARPVVRLFERDPSQTGDAVERVARDIPIHGAVNNWYIDVSDPPRTYRVEVGYVSAASNRFYSLGRSNIVTTPRSGKGGALDENWLDVAANYDKIYAMSGGYETEGDNSQLRELFEERLRRPMGSPMVTRFGNGARSLLPCEEQFEFEVDAEMVVFGSTRPDAYVTLRGEPIRVRDDGTFMVRLPMPEAREVLPIVASSSDGVEQRTVILSIDRNTKVMEPVIRDIGQ